MQNRHIDRLRYFDEQDYTTRKHVIPYLEKFMKIGPDLSVFEIGCGEGGNLKPFLDEGCRVTGIDLADNKIALARSFFEDHPHRQNLTLISDDIYHLPARGEKYDLVFMRDVIEHIHDQEKFMMFVQRFLHPGSLFFLAFPPWQNPFGGHQQICRNRILGMLPYYHLLPEKLYRGFLRLGGESTATIANLLEVKETGISIERFERIIQAASFRMISKEFFFFNPNYEVKFGLKPVRQAGWITRIPHLRNFLTTSVYYLLAV